MSIPGDSEPPFRRHRFFRNPPFYPFDNISFAANSSLPQRPSMVRFIIFNLLAYSRFYRTAGSHSLDMQGHIKRTVLTDQRSRDSLLRQAFGYAFSIRTVNPVVRRLRMPSNFP